MRALREEVVYQMAPEERATAEVWYAAHYCLVSGVRLGLAFAFSKETGGIMPSAWAVCLDCGKRHDVTDWSYA